ncbi:MAG: alanine racemase [Balneolales bacterium]
MPSSYAEINLDVLLQNFLRLQSYLKPGTKQMSVIKADAYGHGAVRVAHVLESYTDWFAVVNVDEAIELRESGITKDILVFGPPTKTTVSAYPEYNLTAVISHMDHFEILKEETAYHVEFDTGMGRLGIDCNSCDEVRTKISQHEELYLKGVMTHFASADIPGDPKTAEQIKIFDQIREEFAYLPDILLHAANTAGILCYPESHYDMVRHGLGLYGYDSKLIADSKLKPVLQWKSCLVQCKWIQKGSTVSYGAQWTAPENGFLGVVPVGYADGFKRNLGGKAKVSINGNYYPIVGRVTMDFIMVFLGDQYYDVGTDVIILGTNGNNADVMAQQIDTIPYEILCGLHNRVKRFYLSTQD